MSRKYIRQIINQDFVFPNNAVYEYDVEIIHDINNNSVSGTITNLNTVSASTTGITLSHDWTWTQNGAETFIDASGNLQLFSVHMMTPDELYFKPWRLVDNVVTANTTGTTFSGTNTFTVLPSDFSITGFTSGEYLLEFRFIGHRAIYPVCGSEIITVVATTPTPTPTVTATGTATPTPTPTLTSTPGLTPTQTPTPTTSSAGSKSLEIYGRDVDGTPSTLTLFYSKNGGGNINVPGATGTQLPGTCSFIYTITGLTEFDSIEFGTSISCVMTGNGSSSSCPSSIGSAITYTYVIDAPSTQQVAITIDSGNIP